MASEINTRQPLAAVLQALCQAAVRSLDGVDHVGISVVHRSGRIETLASTGPLVSKLDQLQYDLNEGPCVDAMRHEGMIIMNHTDTEQRWPRYMQGARELGLGSQMGLRLYAESQTVGGLNLYSAHDGGIDPDVVYVAELFATHAALALGKSRHEDDLQMATRSQRVVGQAVGLLMERCELDSDRAFSYLVRLSNTTNTKVRVIAEELVRMHDEANGLPMSRSGPNPTPSLQEDFRP